MITQTYNLNMIPDRVKPMVYVSQYDEARRIVFNLYNGSVEYEPTSASVLIDGTELTATVSGNQVTVDIPSDLTQVAQIVEGEVRAGDVMGSCNFKFKVDSTPIEVAQTDSTADSI